MCKVWSQRSCIFSGRDAEGLASQVGCHMPTGEHKIEVKCTCELGECTHLWYPSLARVAVSRTAVMRRK